MSGGLLANALPREIGREITPHQAARCLPYGDPADLLVHVDEVGLRRTPGPGG